jgi:hypothetical protein
VPAVGSTRWRMTRLRHQQCDATKQKAPDDSEALDFHALVTGSVFPVDRNAGSRTEKLVVQTRANDGDGVLAEFASVVDATRCSLEVQPRMASRCCARAARPAKHPHRKSRYGSGALSNQLAEYGNREDESAERSNDLADGHRRNPFRIGATLEEHH